MFFDLEKSLFDCLESYILKKVVKFSLILRNLSFNKAWNFIRYFIEQCKVFSLNFYMDPVIFSLSNVLLCSTVTVKS